MLSWLPILKSLIIHLTLNLLNFWNEIMHLLFWNFLLSFLGISTSVLNSYHAEFLKWNNPSSTFGTIHYHFRDIKMKTWVLVSQQYMALSDCTNVQADLALYCWQRLIFGVCRIRVKIGQPTVYFCSACGSILVAKTNHFQFQQGRG